MAGLWRETPEVVAHSTALALCLLIAGSAAAQAYKPPRTPYGQPDLQGVWNNDTMTRLQRPKDIKALAATPDEIATLEKKGFDRYAKVIAPIHPDEPAPTDGKLTDDENFEPPQGLMRIGGQARTSQITSPDDGRLPYTPASRAAADKALKDEDVFDDPEGRPFDERCLLGGGGGVAAPIMNRDLVQIIQTPGYVVLSGEQNHEVRIIRLDPQRRHLHSNIRLWMGDTVGWWEGATLVAETTNLNPTDAWRWSGGDWIALSKDARITERFTRTAPAEILYSYIVDDAAHYTQPWRGEMQFRASTARVFEWACHEGNYALTGILAGGRQKDSEAEAARK